MKLRALLLAGLLALAGCESDGEPEPDAEATAVRAEGDGDPLAPPPGETAPLRERAEGVPPLRERAEGVPPLREGQPPGKAADLWPAPKEAPRASEPGAAERKIDVVFHQAELGEALELLGKLAGIQVELTRPLATPPRISLALKQEPWRRALERVLAAAGGEFAVRGQADVIRVVPRSVVVSGEVLAKEGGALTVRDDDEVTVRLTLPEGPEGSDAAKARAEVRPLFETLEAGDRVVAACQLVGDDRVMTSLATQ